MLGVTRYQWARMTAATEPPVTAESASSWTSSGTPSTGPLAQPSAPSASATTPAITPADAQEERPVAAQHPDARQERQDRERARWPSER